MRLPRSVPHRTHESQTADLERIDRPSLYVDDSVLCLLAQRSCESREMDRVIFRLRNNGADAVDLRDPADKLKYRRIPLERGICRRDSILRLALHASYITLLGKLC